MPRMKSNRLSPISYRSYRSSGVQEKKDYYAVLGVPKTATKEEIKKKFRELAKKYHPDLNKDDKSAAKKFQEVSEAYEVLESDEKRKNYDTFGHAGVDPNFTGGDAGGNPFGGFGGFGGFGNGGFRVHTTNMNGMDVEDIFDVFQQAMGGGRASTGVGQDVQTTATLSFLEAVSGCSKQIHYEYFIREPIASSGGRRQYQKIRKSKSVTVDIPPGVDTGVTMKVTGKGGEGTNGLPSGDLYVELQVQEDAYFKRQDHDIYVEVPITISQVSFLLCSPPNIIFLRHSLVSRFRQF
jgi:molecular chaperone DnaJ